MENEKAQAGNDGREMTFFFNTRSRKLRFSSPYLDTFC
jgi:hypothetical protein